MQKDKEPQAQKSAAQRRAKIKLFKLKKRTAFFFWQTDEQTDRQTYEFKRASRTMVAIPNCPRGGNRRSLPFFLRYPVGIWYHFGKTRESPKNNKQTDRQTYESKRASRTMVTLSNCPGGGNRRSLPFFFALPSRHMIPLWQNARVQKNNKQMDRQTNLNVLVGRWLLFQTAPKAATDVHYLFFLRYPVGIWYNFGKTRESKKKQQTNGQTNKSKRTSLTMVTFPNCPGGGNQRSLPFFF